MLELFRRFVKYGGVAAGSAAADWIVFVALHALGLNYLVGQVISRIAGGVFSFLMNRYWSFRAGARGVTVQGRRFLILYGFSYVLSLTLLYVQVDLFGLGAYLAKLVSDGLVFVVNFVVMNNYVYKDVVGLSRVLHAVRRALRGPA